MDEAAEGDPPFWMFNFRVQPEDWLAIECRIVIPACVPEFLQDEKMVLEIIDGWLPEKQKLCGPCLRSAARDAKDFVADPFPDPRGDPKSRSLNGGSYKVPFSS